MNMTASGEMVESLRKAVYLSLPPVNPRAPIDIHVQWPAIDIGRGVAVRQVVSPYQASAHQLHVCDRAASPQAEAALASSGEWMAFVE